MTASARGGPEAVAARSPMRALARLLGCTEGQAYTALVCTVVTVVAASLGIPPTLRDRAPASAASAAPTQGRAAAPSGGDAPEGTPVAPPDVAAPQAVPLDPLDPAPPAGPPVAPTGGTGGANVDGAAPRVPATAAAPRRFGAARVAARVGQPGAPDGVAVDDAGRIYVATNNGLRQGSTSASRVFRYRTDGTLERDLAVSGQSSARGGGLTGLVVADRTVFVLDTAPARVLRVDVDAGRQATFAAIPDVPMCAAAGANRCEAGVVDDPPSPRGLALAPGGTMYVADAAQGTIWRVARDGAVEPWHRFDDTGPLGGPAGVVVDAAGDLLVTATSGAGSGQVLRIDVRPDGTAGEVATVADTGAMSAPAGIATTDGGAIAVALAGSDVLLLLAANGSELARLTAGAVAAQAGVPLDAPTGVALRGATVLVTNQSSPGADPAHWAVLAVPLAP